MGKLNDHLRKTCPFRTMLMTGNLKLLIIGQTIWMISRFSDNEVPDSVIKWIKMLEVQKNSQICYSLDRTSLISLLSAHKMKSDTKWLQKRAFVSSIYSWNALLSKIFTLSSSYVQYHISVKKKLWQAFSLRLVIISLRFMPMKM